MFWQLTLYRAIAADVDGPLARLLGSDDDPLVSFLLSPLVLLVSLAIGTVILHFCLWILGGAKRTMSTTARVVAYSYSPQLFVVIPFLGTVTGGIWMVVLSIIGLREAHATDGWRAAVAVLLPIAGLMLLMMLLIFALAALGTGVPGMPV